MRIDDGCLVSIEVSMYDAQGQLLEKTEAPLVYLHGAGDIFPRVEAALAGQEAGFRTSLTLQPEDAFGDVDVSLLHLVECHLLGPKVEPGMRYEGLPGRADGRIYTVTDVAEGMAVLDGNHPLAGFALRFDLAVCRVERASADQLAGAERAELPGFLRVVEPQDLHRPSGDRGH
ncbi:MAG: peptidylprolyl isomerase [Burkholderiaceae bacterium]|nr:peptidylprolyl isomerase [Burkholderiaceae bacterium]